MGIKVQAKLSLGQGKNERKKGSVGRHVGMVREYILSTPLINPQLQNYTTIIVLAQYKT